MTRGQKWFMVACLGAGLIIGPFLLIAQQQYSGGQAVAQAGTWTVQPGNTANTTAWKVDGSAVTQPISGNVGQSGTWTVQPGNTANTTAWKVDGSAVTQPASLASLPALAAGTAKVGITYPYTSCGTTQVETGSPAGLAAMPTSPTAAFSATTCVLEMTFYNTDSVSRTITITDNAGTPISALSAVTLIAGETRNYNCPNGCKFNAGLKWSASSANVTGYILGVQ